MANIKELRRLLQHPRRPFDTVYGKLVMRPLSIYFTAFFLRIGASPLAVTLISIVLGVAGGILLAQRQWFLGLFLVNLWYLLDHTDGELARFYNRVSPTGLYFDTIANAFVHPSAFLGLGAGLAAATNTSVWFFVGLAAAYSSLMFLIIPFCEATVLLQWISEDKAVLAKVSKEPAGRANIRSWPRNLFAGVHYFTTFPVILPLITLATCISFFAPAGIRDLIPAVLLAVYAAASAGIWLLILCNQFVTRKLDSKLTLRS